MVLVGVQGGDRGVGAGPSEHRGADGGFRGLRVLVSPPVCQALCQAVVGVTHPSFLEGWAQKDGIAQARVQGPRSQALARRREEAQTEFSGFGL